MYLSVVQYGFKVSLRRSDFDFGMCFKHVKRIWRRMWIGCLKFHVDSSGARIDLVCVCGSLNVGAGIEVGLTQ